MRTIINFIVALAVFYFGSIYFSDYIAIDDTKTVILSALVMVAVPFVLSWIMALSFFLIPLGIGCLGIIVSLIAYLFFIPLSLYGLDTYMPGFALNGIETYVLLTIIFMIFNVSFKTTSSTESSK